MTAATNTTVATANTTTPPAICHAHTSQHHQNNVLTEQQRRILKRPSSSPSKQRRQTPTSITTITLDDDPDTEELPSTSKDSKQPKIEVEMVPIVVSEADVVDHQIATDTDIKEENHQQQPLINSTCDKIEPSECSGEVAIVAMDQDEDVVELVQPAMAAIAAVTPAKAAVALPESLPTNPEVVNQFVSYFQSVELAAGEFHWKASIWARFHCFSFQFRNQRAFGQFKQ